MILTRRQFLKASAALVAAPAIVKAENLMKIEVPGKRVKFRVPDLRGHYATRPEPLNMYPEREMSAVEKWAQQNEVSEGWDNRYQTSIRAQYADAAGRAVNNSIEEQIYNEIAHVDSAHDSRLAGHKHTGVWMDEAPQSAVRLEHLINQKTGEIVITDGPALGCIPCDGRELSAIEYPHLFQVLGNKYG